MSQPVSHKRAAVPLTYEFNNIVAASLFFLDWRGQEVPKFYVIDHGTHFQWCGRLQDRSALDTGRRFQGVVDQFGPTDRDSSDGTSEF